MKKQLAKTALAFTCFYVAIAVCGMVLLERNMTGVSGAGADTENKLVLLNEIEQLTTDDSGYNPAHDKLAILKSRLRQEALEEQVHHMRRTAAFFICFTVFYLLMGFWYIYFKIVRPFYKLEDYAQQIAKGNLDISLQYERTNFFGAFTWAFDHMRKEIITARKNEAQAVSENKTIIATLSHDIKTPIASIRAYAEGLEANLEADYGQRERYLQVMIRKCDEVSRLVNDLVLHSLSELERLEIKEQKVSMEKVLQETLQDLEYPYIALREPLPDAALWVDEKRMAQALLNILENAKKYAPESKIDIWATLSKERYEIHIRDYGRGILPEDIPFVTRKFYRGKNVGEQSGSGLGLYIVDYIMEKMKGGLTLKNHADGLEAVLWLPAEGEEHGDGYGQKQKADNRTE